MAMIKLLKPFVFVAALTGGTVNPYAPSTIDLAKLNTDLTAFSATSVAFINKALTPVTPEAAPVDPVAVANVNEDLDYRIAAQTKSVEGWRSFLAAHPHGAHAPAAQGELDKLEPPPAPAPTVAELKTPSEQFEFFRFMERQSAEAPDAKTTVVEVPEPITTTIVKWRERRVVRWRVARPRHRAEPSTLPSFFLALFGDQRARASRR
jgi:hypothetical protein